MTASARRIVGSIIQSGRIFKAGDEDALAALLPAADTVRLVEAGQLAGEWGDVRTGDVRTGDGSGDEHDSLPPLAKMADYLAGFDNVDELTAVRTHDTRKGAQPMYEARLAALTAASEG